MARGVTSRTSLARPDTVRDTSVLPTRSPALGKAPGRCAGWSPAARWALLALGSGSLGPLGRSTSGKDVRALWEVRRDGWPRA